MNKLALSVVTVSILIGASPFLADNLLLDEQKQFEAKLDAIVMDANVDERISYHPKPDNKSYTMRFGEMPAGTPVTRYFNYSSTGPQRIVEIEIRGNISEKMEYESSQIVRGVKHIPLRFESNETGYFEGNATLKTLTPKGRAGDLWLDLKSIY